MDDRTARLLAALDPVAGALLVELLARGPSTEAELLKAIGHPLQPTGNRRLHRLGRTQLVAREPGKAQAPGRRWTVIHPAETEAFLTALMTLSEAIEARDRARRAQTKRRLKRARAERLGIRKVDDGTP